MTFKLKSSGIIKFLLFTILVLLSLNLIGIYIEHFTGWDEIKEHVVRLVDFDTEQNIPTYFSTMILLFSSALLTYIAAVNKRNGKDMRHWGGLALIFAFLSLDEAVSLHETFIGPVRALTQIEGFLYFAWVIPYGFFTLLLVLYYGKFLFNLPHRVRNLMIVSAGVYLFGALVLEMIGGNYYSSTGYRMDYIFSLIATVEELCEMVGVTIFISSLLIHIKTELNGLSLKVKVKEKEKVKEQELKRETANAL